MAATKTRTLLIFGVVLAIVFFVIGLLTGHFGIKKRSDGGGDGDPGSHSGYIQTSCDGTTYTDAGKKYKDGYLGSAVERACYGAGETCHSAGLPRTYLAYHLGTQTINMDGRLDDPAWAEVPWTDSFVDIRGMDYPTPFLDTKVKVRWDDNRLYIGARMEETHFWGNITEDEMKVWTENAFEVYAVPDGSFHHYKEMEINVMNVTWDLMLNKAYIDRPPCTEDTSVVVGNWSSDQEKKTYTDGVVNDLTAPGTFWSVEWSFTFDALAVDTDRPANQARPIENEAWFMIFARPEYGFKTVNGKYVKDDSAETHWWVWQPTYAVNLHLPSRFGLVQFKKNLNDKTFQYDKWHIYKALFAVFDAEHKYKSVNGMFIDDLTKLDIAPIVFSENCVDVTLQLTDGGDFQANVTSRVLPSLQTGHIRADRYAWFT